MAFDNSKITGRSQEDIERAKAARENYLFGNAQIDTSTYPTNEKVDLPISLIDSNPDNEIVFGMDEVVELAGKIEDEGFFGVVEVYLKPNGRFELLAGHRRFEAYKKLGKHTIPAIIYEMDDSIAVIKHWIGSNIESRKLKPLNYARAIEYYINRVLIPSGFTGDKIKACSDFFHKSTSQIKRFRTYNKLIPELQQLLNYDDFPFTGLDGFITFTNDEQKHLYDEISCVIEKKGLSEITREDIRECVNLIKNGSNKDSADNEVDTNFKIPDLESQMVRRGPIIEDNNPNNSDYLFNDTKGFTENLLNGHNPEQHTNIPEEENKKQEAQENNKHSQEFTNISVNYLMNNVGTILTQITNNTLHGCDKTAVIKNIHNIEHELERIKRVIDED